MSPVLGQTLILKIATHSVLLYTCCYFLVVDITYIASCTFPAWISLRSSSSSKQCFWVFSPHKPSEVVLNTLRSPKQSQAFIRHFHSFADEGYKMYIEEETNLPTQTPIARTLLAYWTSSMCYDLLVGFQSKQRWLWTRGNLVSTFEESFIFLISPSCW